MIVGLEGAGLPIYQDQVSRENQIQRDQERNQEVEETNPQQVTSDTVSFSPEAVALAQDAVTATNEAPEVAVDQESQEAQPQPESVPQGATLPGQYLDLQV